MELIEPKTMQLTSPGVSGEYVIDADARYLRWIEELRFFQLLMYRLVPNTIVHKLIQEKKKFYIRNTKTHNIVEVKPNHDVRVESDWSIQYRVLRGTKMVVVDDWDMVVIMEDKDLPSYLKPAPQLQL